MWTKDEGSTQGDSSDNTLHVLDEFRGEKSDDERNASQTSAMQSMYILFVIITFTPSFVC